VNRRSTNLVISLVEILDTELKCPSNFVVTADAVIWASGHTVYRVPR
jgi:hypothetical protein